MQRNTFLLLSAVIIAFGINFTGHAETVTIPVPAAETVTYPEEIVVSEAQLEINRNDTMTTAEEELALLEAERQAEIEEQENYLLACIVMAEAGNQDLIGKELVACVVLNRVDSPRFPNTITEVIYQKHQFSTVTDGALERAYKTVTEDCFKAVENARKERRDKDILFFAANGYNGKAAYKYGDHYFSY